MDLCGKIDTDAKCRDEEEIRNNLNDGMEPEKPGEAEQPNANSTKGEEDDKSQRCKNTMSDHSTLSLLKVAAEWDREACRALTKA